MSVNVHESGCDEAALRVDFFRAAARHATDDANDASVDGNVSVDWFSAATVEDRPAANDQVVRHRHRFPSLHRNAAHRARVTPVGAFVTKVRRPIRQRL